MRFPITGPNKIRMSMHENPGSGYVVALPDLVSAISKALPKTKRKVFKVAIENAIGDFTQMRLVLAEYMTPLGMPAPQWVLILGEDDTSDGSLEKDVWYVGFAESDLYVRSPKPELNQMRKLQIEPLHHSWTIFG
jgi:hypothetical protein